METKFQHKFEYTDFLIELTIVKNYLKTIYAKKLKVWKFIFILTFFFLIIKRNVILKRKYILIYSI